MTTPMRRRLAVLDDEQQNKRDPIRAESQLLARARRTYFLTRCKSRERIAASLHLLLDFGRSKRLASSRVVQKA